jgi:hypothetical protein
MPGLSITLFGLHPLFPEKLEFGLQLGVIPLISCDTKNNHNKIEKKQL